MKLNWKTITIISITIIFTSLLFFIIGIAFGASITTNDFIETFIPIFSALGSWVSGIGAIAAVFVALWLAEDQSRKDSERLEITLEVAMIPDMYEGLLICISATSVGLRPSLVSMISITCGKNVSSQLAFTKFSKFSDELPRKLNYGDRATWFLTPDSEKTIANYIKSVCSGNAEGLTLNIKTSTTKFSSKPNNDFINMIKSHIK